MLRHVLTAAALLAFAACSTDPSGPDAPPVPRVEARLVTEAPVPPDDLKVSCLVAADELAASPTCPVLVRGTRTWWAFSFGDNRSAFGIVGYEDGAVTGRIDRTGARYLLSIEVNAADSTVSLIGQDNRTVTVAWDELP